MRKELLITQSKGSFAKKFYVSHANLRQCANFAGYGRMLVLQMENSYRFFPYLATVCSFLAVGVWAALYIVGFLL